MGSCYYLVFTVLLCILAGRAHGAVLCRPTVDVIFLLDGSDSISPGEFQQQKDFITRFVQLSDVSDSTVRVGLAVVSSNVEDTLALSQGTHEAAVLTAVHNISQPQEGSRTDIGLVRMEQMFGTRGRPGVLRIGVILTDGNAKYEQATVGEASVVKDSGVFLVAIGVGRLINFDELVKLATTKSNAYHLVPMELSSKLLSETVKFLGRESCTGHQLVDPSWTQAPQSQPMTTQAPELPPLYIQNQPQLPPFSAFQLLSHLKIPTAPDVTLVPLAPNVTLPQPTAPKQPPTQLPVTSPTVLPFIPTNAKPEVARFVGHVQPRNDAASVELKVADLIKSFIHSSDILMPAKNKQAAFEMPVKRLYEFETIGNITLDTPQGHIKEIIKIEKLPITTTTTTTTTARPSTTTFSTMPSGSLTSDEKHALCAKGKIFNGAVYTHKRGSCSEFFQCFDVNGVTTVETGRCPFETFYDDHNGVCRYHEEMACWRDPCSDMSIQSYRHPGNCRAYWSCRGRTSKPMCCPMGASYIPGQGCVRNISCTDPCMDFGNLNIVTAASLCKLLPLETNDHFFFEDVAGLGWMIRRCPEGSVFDRTLCTCKAGDELLVNTCKPELFMDFNDGFRDKSGQNLAMGLNQVDLEGGAARFNGRALIKLWRFSGVSLGQKVTVSFRFRVSVTAKRGKLMHIVSNCCYGCTSVPEPSIDIAIVPGDTDGIAVFSARTIEADEVFVYVPYKETVTGWNYLEYTYDGFTLTGSVNGDTATENVIGDIIGRPEELTIGTCGTGGGYDGYLDDFKFYTCVP